VSPKAYGYFPLEICPKIQTWKILLRYIDRRNMLSTLLKKDGCPECGKLDCRLSSKMIIPPSSVARPLVYRNNHQAVSTAQFRRAC